MNESYEILDIANSFITKLHVRQISGYNVTPHTIISSLYQGFTALFFVSFLHTVTEAGQSEKRKTQMQEVTESSAV